MLNGFESTHVDSEASDPSGSGPRFNAHLANILLLDFLFSCSKVCNANIGIITNFG